MLNTKVGYTGGSVPNPTYQQVCSHDTGHAEAVRVEFDPDRVSYEALLNVFFDCHNPTLLNRQGPDEGSQYRSAIFYHDDAQREAAQAMIAKLAGDYDQPIVTQIVPATEFYLAEEYHQQYVKKHGSGGCAT